MKEFKFTLLLRKQWSWNNDRSCLGVYFLIALVSTYINHFVGDITVTPESFYWAGASLYFIAFWLFLVITYQSIKFLIMFLFCALVTSEANKGNSTAINTYEEMLVWRQ